MIEQLFELSENQAIGGLLAGVGLGSLGWLWRQLRLSQYRRLRERTFDVLDSLLQPDHYTEVELRLLINLVVNDLTDGEMAQRLLEDVHGSFSGKALLIRKNRYQKYLSLIRGDQNAPSIED